jgi:hypothetical protein
MFSFGGGTASGSQREPQETERGSHGNAVAVFLIPGDSLIEIVRSALVVALPAMPPVSFFEFKQSHGIAIRRPPLMPKDRSCPCAKL